MRQTLYRVVKPTLLAQLLLASLAVNAQTMEDAWRAFSVPQDTCRTKVWWFHGETETTREGITADLEAYKKAGVGGVVYYDQVHKPTDKALDAMSPEWWNMLKFAAKEAKRIGLTFEINISNGYVMGGKWIEKSEAMRRLVGAETIVGAKERKRDKVMLPVASKDDSAQSVAVFAIRLRDYAPEAMRSVTYTTKATGKSRNGAMNTPTAKDGMLFVERPAVGVLEASDDSVAWREVCQLPPVYGSPSCSEQTVGFAPVRAKYFRTRITDPALLQRKDKEKFIANVRVSPFSRLTGWQERAGLRSEFVTPLDYSIYKVCTEDINDVVDVTEYAHGDTLQWRVPKGNWMVVRLQSEATGGRSKHGRKNLLGLEADMLSDKGVLKHWKSYTQPIIDTLSAIGVKPVGVTMDSHEAAAQNWTADFEREFKARRGYDLRRWLPAMLGYVMVSPEKTDSVLADVRRTIADLVCDKYFGTIQRLCRENGVTLTAQAVGNGLSMVADNFRAKGMVDKPQGEFWARDKDGSYDIKECASAAHRYGKKIASAEAFTDMKFSETLGDVKPLADYAYSCHVNEFVVCASAYQPWLDRFPGSTGGGRHYCLNRNNTLWADSQGFWDYQARCAAMMRQGDPVVDMRIKLPDTPPTKLLAAWLPDSIPNGYTWEVTTERADTSEMTKTGVPDMEDSSEHSPKSELWFSHRRLVDGEIYFIANHSAKRYEDIVRLRANRKYAYYWNPLDGTRQSMDILAAEGGSMTVPLRLEPDEAGFVVLADERVDGLQRRIYSEQPVEVIPMETADLTFVNIGKRLEGQSFTDWTKSDDPAIRYYSGVCRYEMSLNVSKKTGRYMLTLPKVNGNVRVSVNGHDAGVMWCSPWRLDVTPYIKKGKNAISLSVTNVLSNRMIGDVALPEAERVTFSQPQIYSKNDALKPSGIFGGVPKLEIIM